MILCHLRPSGAKVAYGMLSTGPRCAVWGLGSAALPGALAPTAAPAPALSTVSSLPWVVSLWGMGMLLFGARFFGGLVQVRSLRRRDHRPVSAALQERVRVLALSLGIVHPVSVVESFQTTVPMVVGIIRPLILLPSSALAGLTPEQLESIVLHELAHIRRRDLWVGFGQGQGIFTKGAT